MLAAEPKAARLETNSPPNANSNCSWKKLVEPLEPFLDAVTQRNLELLESPRTDRAHTLIGCLDRTLTPMGARLLREWVTHPLKTVPQIHDRQCCGTLHARHLSIIAAGRGAANAAGSALANRLVS